MSLQLRGSAPWPCWACLLGFIATEFGGGDPCILNSILDSYSLQTLSHGILPSRSLKSLRSALLTPSNRSHPPHPCGANKVLALQPHVLQLLLFCPHAGCVCIEADGKHILAKSTMCADSAKANWPFCLLLKSQDWAKFSQTNAFFSHYYTPAVWTTICEQIYYSLETKTLRNNRHRYHIPLIFLNTQQKACFHFLCVCKYVYFALFVCAASILKQCLSPIWSASVRGNEVLKASGMETIKLLMTSKVLPFCNQRRNLQSKQRVSDSWRRA